MLKNTFIIELPSKVSDAYLLKFQKVRISCSWVEKIVFNLLNVHTLFLIFLKLVCCNSYSFKFYVL